MCRLAAYLGPELVLQRLLEEPPHSLVKQSWAPQEMEDAALNADGFGFGWHDPAGRPASYTCTLPIWSDPNLAGLGRSLKSGVWLANIRSATPGQAVSQANTQPFVHGGTMFIHNGYLDGFSGGVKEALHRHLSPPIQADIHGDTDSEYLFALFRQAMANHGGDPVRALQGALQDLAGILAGGSALLNMVVHHDGRLLACRHALNGGKCPSLYYTDAHPNFPHACLIASERFSLPEAWGEAEEHSMLVFSAGRPVERFGL